jgi:hypothetical protein
LDSDSDGSHLGGHLRLPLEILRTRYARQSGTYPKALARIIDMLRVMEKRPQAQFPESAFGSTEPVDPIVGKFGDLDTSGRSI